MKLKILDLIRETKKPTLGKTLIREQEEKGELDTTELKEEEKKFRDTVTPRVKFNRFKLYS